MPDIKTLKRQIAGGSWDEHLVDIATAIAARKEDGDAPRECWGFKFDDLDITENDITVEEAIDFERVTGIMFHAANPHRSTFQHFALLASCLVARKGMTPDEAGKAIKDRPAHELRASLYTFLDVDAPLGESSEPSKS